MWIWRAIGSPYCTLAEVKDGTCSLVDVLKIVTLMQADAAEESAAYERAKDQ